MTGSIVPLNFQGVKVEFIFSETRLTVLQGAFLRLGWMRPFRLIHYHEKICIGQYLMKIQRATLMGRVSTLTTEVHCGKKHFYITVHAPITAVVDLIQSAS